MQNNSDINISGFLSEDIKNFENTMLNKYGDILALYKDFNRHLHDFKFKMHVTNEDIRKIAVTTLFIKALQTYQAIYILSVKGAVSDAESLCRNLYETMVKIEYCCKNDDCFKRYLCTYYHKLLNIINAAIDRQQEFGKGFSDKNRLEEAKDKRRSELKEMGDYSPIQIEEMARQISNADNKNYYIKTYQVFFRSTSGEVHSSPSSLEKFVDKDENNEVQSFLWGPREDISIIFSAVEFMLNIYKTLFQLFNIDGVKEFNSFNAQNMVLFKKYFPDLNQK